MRRTSIDPSLNPAAHLLGIGSILAVLVAGAVSLLQATPSWWRLLLVPLAVLPVLTLRRPAALLLAVSDDPWVELALVRSPAGADGYDLEAARALRFGVAPAAEGSPDSGVSRAA
jgi:hypothetical protein